MSDAQLELDIRAWLRDNARGHAAAKPRRALLVWLCAQGHWPTPNDTADRALRKFKETMPDVGSCTRGYFLILTAEDRHVAEGQLAAPAATMFAHQRELKKAAPTGQMELW
jgi:hypothetical protein